MQATLSLREFNILFAFKSTAFRVVQFLVFCSIICTIII